jgi:hypothetical protein
MLGLFVRRKQVWKSTWLLRLLVVGLACGLLWATSSWWALPVGQSLVCESDIQKSDAILIENMDPNYLLFERAADLRERGYASRVIALVQATGEGDHEPGLVSVSIAEVMARLAHLEALEFLPIEEVEPYTMNAAYQTGSHFERSGFRSAIVVSDGFRSRRTHLVYRKAFDPLGIAVTCAPVWGSTRPENWMQTWHGIQEVLLQATKLAYYRAWVLWR